MQICWKECVDLSEGVYTNEVYERNSQNFFGLLVIYLKFIILMLYILNIIALLQSYCFCIEFYRDYKLIFIVNRNLKNLEKKVLIFIWIFFLSWMIDEI